ncbi:MAG: winged helix DNA-binding domain-containing protein [Candidatus Ventricola sp.]
MTREEVCLCRLSGQHLLSPAEPQSVAKDLCGLQAQFLSHALHALSIRSHHPDVTGLVRSWTNRGTLHLFAAEDLPLFLHAGKTRHLRPVDTLEADPWLSAERKKTFARMIVAAIAEGTDEREALKAVCESAGMTQEESRSLFDPWGGIIRALCECGCICCKVQERKAYQLCPPFEPMEETVAQQELLRRYLIHYGPASVKDAAYFFGTTQAKIKAMLPQLPVTEVIVDGKPLFGIDTSIPRGCMPDCLFLAGFDPLMLGYEKPSSLFLPGEYVRDIFTLSGIVRPAVLVRGKAVGWWNLKNRCLTVHLFEAVERQLVLNAAQQQWPCLKQIALV